MKGLQLLLLLPPSPPYTVYQTPEWSHLSVNLKEPVDRVDIDERGAVRRL